MWDMPARRVATDTELRFNPYHDEKGRFCSGNGLTSGGTSGKIKENIFIGRSVGASGKNYPVKLPDGGYGKFAEGSSITKIKVFAGYGTGSPIRNEIFIKSAHKINCKQLQKVRGEAVIIADKQRRKAEIHWYEDENSNRYDFKVKRWIDI